MEKNAECMLVIIGATPEGKKELIGFQVGLRESAQSWHELLSDIKGRGLSVPPEIAVGDGAMGFWNALDRTFPGTKHQRCWVHKVKNVLNCFPKPMASAVKSDLDDIQHAGSLLGGNQHGCLRSFSKLRFCRGKRRDKSSLPLGRF